MAKKANNKVWADIGKSMNIDIHLLENNEGQVAGIPKNPRFIKGEEYDKLKKSLTDAPELLQYKPLMVYATDGGKYVTICGNMRLRVCQELNSKGTQGFDKLPCFVLNSDVSINKVKEYAIKDNVQAGNWDWDELGNNWDVGELTDWGVDCSFLNEEDEKPLEKTQEKEQEDYSDELTTSFKIEVDCKDEGTMQQLYEELTEERGFECRILTL